MDIAATSKSADGSGRAARSDRRGPVAVWLFVCCALDLFDGGGRRYHSAHASPAYRSPNGSRSSASCRRFPPPTGLPSSPSTKQIPEYRLVHYGMRLDEFKSIYCWEYAHRLLGRLIGVAFARPFVWFLVRGRLPRRLVPPLCGILLLGFAQGGLGWYMVEERARRPGRSQPVPARCPSGTGAWRFTRQSSGWRSDIPGRAPHPDPLPASGEREVTARSVPG